MSNLNTAISLAAELHDGQVDKAGVAYIYHPLRVMLSLYTEEERIVGVLHDVAEDHDLGRERIECAGFSQRIQDAIDAITRKEGEVYPCFIERVAQNPIARVVKIADIRDNLDRSCFRSKSLTRRYKTALKTLENASEDAERGL